MKVIVIAAALLLVLFIAVIKAETCGGELEGENGEFSLASSISEYEEHVCIWIIQLASREFVTFKLESFADSKSWIFLYPEQKPGTTPSPTRLTSFDVGKAFQAPGKTLIVVLTRPDPMTFSGLSFTWDSAGTNTSNTVTTADYVSSKTGHVLWNRFSQQERITWVLNNKLATSVGLRAEINFQRCQLPNPCECSYFGLFEITPSGYFEQATSVCGRPATFSAKRLSPKQVAIVYANSTEAGGRVDLTWTTLLPSNDEKF